MKIEGILDNLYISEHKLLEYGFKKCEDKFIYKRNLKDEKYFIEIIVGEEFEIKVFENEEEFLPFYVKNLDGEYVNSIRKEVFNIIDEIKEKCFDHLDVKGYLMNYAVDKYKSEICTPFSTYPEYITLNASNGKWYALFMNISISKLGLEGSYNIDVLNLKNTHEKVASIVDDKNYFKAYHMNKKHWFSVILNKNSNLEEVKKLLDESYELVKK